MQGHDAEVSKVEYSDATSVILVEPRGSRRGLIIYNDTDVTLYIKFGDDGDKDDYSLQVLTQTAYVATEKFVYVGRVSGTWDTGGSGYARITERRQQT